MALEPLDRDERGETLVQTNMYLGPVRCGTAHRWRWSGFSEAKLRRHLPSEMSVYSGKDRLLVRCMGQGRGKAYVHPGRSRAQGWLIQGELEPQSKRRHGAGLD